MKLIFLLSLFISINAQASGKCFLYEVKGVVQIKGKDIQLIANKGTMSEFVFSIKASEEHKLAPYLDGTSVGTYIFKRKPQSSDEIVSVKTISRSTPDPINHSKNSYVKELKAVECH